MAERARRDGRGRAGRVGSGSPRRRATRAAAVFGFGLGGLIDGIVLHQILQWHHLVSSRTEATTLEGLQANTFADGLFHAAVLVVLIVGAVLLGRAIPGQADGWSEPAAGGALVGFGGFHLVDGIAFHAMLGLHHIRMVDNYLVYDLAFAAGGSAVAAVGMLVLHRGSRRRAASSLS